MYIASIPNRNSPPAILLRESYREDGKVKSRTLSNLSKLPPYAIRVLDRSLKGETLVSIDEAFQIVEDGSRPHGHVEAVMLAMRRLGFANLIASRPSRQRDLVIAMVVSRIIEPQSKLSTSRWWHSTTLPETLGVTDADEDELYSAMDWILKRQGTIEKKLASRHLQSDGIALYDLTSSYFEGYTCPLAALGYPRDGKKGKLQVNYGLLTNANGIPTAVSVFKGNTADPKTLLPQVYKMRHDFGIESFILVGDRGMITQKQVKKLRDIEGVDWITALRSKSIVKLIDNGALQLGLFDERNLFEFTHPDFTGERFVACRNPEMANRREKKRKDLLKATEKELEAVRRMIKRGRLVGKAVIGEYISKVLKKRKLGRHVTINIRDDGFDFTIDKDKVASEVTRGLIKELLTVRQMVERGRLVGKMAIDKRVSKAFKKRKIGRHITVDVRDDGFDFTIDKNKVVADATRVLVKELLAVHRRVERGQLYGKDAIGVRVGKVINKYKVGKHFILDIRNDGFDFTINGDKVEAEAALDGIYVVHTSASKEQLGTEDVVRSYKQLTQVERAFRTFKTMDLKVRPIYHNLENRVRAHIFLCMLAYYVQWHMVEAWRPLLFCDEDQEAKATHDPVAPAERSEAALRKVHSRRLEDGSTVHSFHTLLSNLGTLVRNICRRVDAPDDEPTFIMVTPPNTKQQQAYNLLKTIAV